MNESEANHGEMRAELEARGWTVSDLAEWLRVMDHEIDPEVIRYWYERGALEDGAAVPRWPLLLMQGTLGALTWPRLRYFQRREFGRWADWMHPALLRALDECRAALDAPLWISGAAGALGRHLQQGTSIHNVDRVGYVMAADVILPRGFPLRDAFQLVHGAGVVSGIGVYPDWQQGPGMHLDVRHLTQFNLTHGATVQKPATWSAVRGAGGAQVYHSVDFVLG